MPTALTLSILAVNDEAFGVPDKFEYSLHVVFPDDVAAFVTDQIDMQGAPSAD